MIDFDLFSRLFRETANYSNVNMFIGERGYHANRAKASGALLTEIWELALCDMKQLRERAGLNKTEFSARYGIPYRTLQNWETTGADHHDAPGYLKMLIAYTILEVNYGKTEEE